MIAHAWRHSWAECGETFWFSVELTRDVGFPPSSRWLVFSDPGFQGMLAVLETGVYPFPETWGFPSPFVGSLRPLKMVRVSVKANLLFSVVPAVWFCSNAGRSVQLFGFDYNIRRPLLDGFPLNSSIGSFRLVTIHCRMSVKL